jgi:hypothetical protein
LPLAILACNLGALAPTAPPTLTAAPAPVPIPPTPTATPAPTPSPTAPPTQAPALEPLFHLVYTDHGDAWYSDGVRPARRLTDSGGITEVYLADDGQLAALLLRDPQQDTAELQVVRTDGSGRRTLLIAEDFDRLHPREEFLLHITPSKLDFIPGTHTLLFNTRAVFEGPGLVKFDDLFALDCDSGELSPLLPPGSGGDFWFSPDGSRLALMRPGSLGVVGTDGTDPHLQLLTFAPVITYSEYAFYPIPVWSPDSTLLRVAVPGPDPFFAPPEGEIWTVPAGGGQPSRMREFRGDLFQPQLAAALISPDLAWVAFTRSSGTGGESQLILASLADGAESVYDRGTIQWTGWAPDSRHFVYTRDGGVTLQLGLQGAPGSPLPSAARLYWLTGDSYVYLSGVPGSWMIMSGGVGRAAAPLAAPAGELVSFDAAAP